MSELDEIRARHEKFDGWLRWFRGASDEHTDRAWLLDEVERQARHIDELQAKIDAERSCACSYDAPGDVCSWHSPALVKAQAEVERLRAELDDLRANNYIQSAY